MRIWRRLGPLLTVILVLNFLPGVSATTPAVAQERPSLTYFALGDSYASGHGLPGADGACLRSNLAYPYVVDSALSESYRVAFNHLGCSGATAGPHPETSRERPMAIATQFDIVNEALDERDRTGNADPVLVTITIGANDLGISEENPEALRQVIKPITSPFTGGEFFEWLDRKTAAIAANLTPGIDRLLAHENVYIVLTDYPNPFREGGFEGLCRDLFDSLSCDERMGHLMLSLTATMAEQVSRVDDRSHLHFTTLGSRFESHFSHCGPFTTTPNAAETWFQIPNNTEVEIPDGWMSLDKFGGMWNLLWSAEARDQAWKEFSDPVVNAVAANMDQCFHPNAAGAQGIADAVLERALTMLPTPTTVQPTQSEADTGSLTVQFWDVRNNVPDTTSQCVQLVGATKVLCANDFPDGQILINGIPAGTYEVCVSRFYPDVPGEPVWAWFRSPASVTIAPGSHETITLNLYLDFEPGERTLCGFDDTTSDSSGSADSAQQTWTASVQASLCDDSSCQAGAGITVDISLASGEWMGSCTTSDPMPTPWDVYISTCAVEGLPYHEDFVATQDPSTIPEGYAPANDPQTLHVEDIHPGGGDQATFMFTNVRTDADASTSSSSGPAAPAEPAAPTEVAVPTEPTGAADPMSLLPSSADVPGGLVETGRYTRPLPDVVANYTDPVETTQLFTTWGWQGNAVASFSLPSGQDAQSGQVNGVYVSIHQFAGPDEARAALDFSLTEQAAGTMLQEITTSPVGEYTRALYGPMDYGNETTVLTQQGSVFIRVSVAMFDGDPTADAVAVTEAILRKVSSAPTAGVPIDPGSSEQELITLYAPCIPLEGCVNATITVTTQDGAFIATGACPDTTEVAPGWCHVPGVPRGIDVVLTLEGIQPGWVVEQNPVYWDTSREINPYMDEAPRFMLVPADGGAPSSTSGSVITADPGDSGEATLLMTFRGCPEGFDPNIGDFWAECTIPLDAPDNAFLDYHGEGQGGMNIAWMDRQHNGEYVYNAVPMTMNVDLYGLEPVVRDDYRVFGADGMNGNGYTVNLSDGETREVYVFYWFN